MQDILSTTQIIYNESTTMMLLQAVTAICSDSQSISPLHIFLLLTQRMSICQNNAAYKGCDWSAQFSITFSNVALSLHSLFKKTLFEQ